jgi:hypothetical protein
MTDAAAPAAPFAENDFRVGRILNRTTSVLSRNFLMFFLVSAVAQLPTLLFVKVTSSAETATSGREIIQMFVVIAIGLVLMIVLSTLSQAVLLYGAFQVMRGRAVNLGDSLQVAWRRFFPIIGLAISMTIFIALAAILLVFPAMILFTMWFVATPVCVVEQLGPSNSMRRSTQLTKGHRWKIFGLALLLFVISGIASQSITLSLTAMGGSVLATIGEIAWGGVWGAFYAVSVVVTYHDLRVAKEGIDIHQIAAVFE